MTRRTPQPFRQSEALANQLLEWAVNQPRTYREAMEAWGTHCPVFPVWEDAVDARLIEVLPAPGVRLADRPVRVTAAGRARLDAAQ
jgi:hypothetical protein